MAGTAFVSCSTETKALSEAATHHSFSSPSPPLLPPFSWAWPQVRAGNIAALVGLKHTISGNTLVSNKASKDLKAHSLAGISIPDPVFTCSIEAEGSDDKVCICVPASRLQLNCPSPTCSFLSFASLLSPEPSLVLFVLCCFTSTVCMQDVEFALDYIQREDPSVHVHVDEETGQTLLSGVCLCLCLCACVCVCL